MAAQMVTGHEAAQKRKEIYTYQAPWLIYGMNWSVRADQRFRLAIGSFEEEYNNSVRIVQLDEESHQFVDCGGFEHPYPTTKIMWMPDQTGNRRDLLATTGDYLRLWNVMDNKSVRLEALLNNNKNTEFCAPLTSFDWNETDPNIIGTSRQGIPRGPRLLVSPRGEGRRPWDGLHARPGLLPSPCPPHPADGLVPPRCVLWPGRHLVHRHDLHNLGHFQDAGQDAADSPRQRGL